MSLKFDETINTENFRIENNILTGAQFTYDLDASNIGKIFLDALNKKPNNISQIDADTGKQTTYAEIRDRSLRCAIWLKKQGIRSDDIITLCTDNHLDACVPILASLYNGFIFNPWGTEINLTRAQRLMHVYKPKIIFASENKVEILHAAAKLENVDVKFIALDKHYYAQSLDEIIELQTREEVEAFLPTEIQNPKETAAFIILSSGTTGFPKGVIYSYDSMLKTVSCVFEYPMKHVSLWYSAPAWITGIMFMLNSFLWQGTRIIHSKFCANETCKIIEKFKVRRMFLSKFQIVYLNKVNANEYNLKSLEFILSGGCKINPNVLQKFKDKFSLASVKQVFGITEIGWSFIYQRRNHNDNYSIGFVRPSVQLKVIDLNTKEALGPNQEGELCVKSETRMLGYYKNPEATKEAFDDEGWYHTGDKVYYNEKGQFFYVERIKEIMKFRGYHVSPAELEEVLSSHPAVTEVAVVAVPHEEDGNHPMAFVKKTPGSNLTEAELVKLSATLGEENKLWGGVKFMDELPKIGNGKIAMDTLKEWIKLNKNVN